MDKKTIRQTMKQKRLSLDEKTFSLYNQKIFNKIITHQKYKESSLVGIYVSYLNEVDTKKIIQYTLKKQRVCVPKIEKGLMSFYEIHSLEELKEGTYHILEPISSTLIHPKDIDLMLVPLLAFDDELYRIGYGKGFYDRYFETGFNGYKIGLAYHFQKVNSFLKNKYDIPLDEIITD